MACTMYILKMYFFLQSLVYILFGRLVMTMFLQKFYQPPFIIESVLYKPVEYNLQNKTCFTYRQPNRQIDSVRDPKL